MQRQLVRAEPAFGPHQCTRDLVELAHVAELLAGEVLALVAALVYVCCSRFRMRGLAFGGTALTTIVALAWWMPSSVMHQRATLAMEEASAWHPEQAQSMQSSVGLRLEFYRNSLEMFKQRPLLGTGTGGFRVGYAEQVADKGIR